MSGFTDNRNGAIFSDDGQYRYRLWRTWDVSKPTIAFVMLNPSTADETKNDPTLRRCINYAKSWGYGKLIVGNLFAVRETDSTNLWDYFDPEGPENDTHLKSIAEDADKIVVAWGAKGKLGDRARFVASMLEEFDLYALNTTKKGHPSHPLYQPSDIDLTLWTVDKIDNENAD